jgi:hypothetical protein
LKWRICEVMIMNFSRASHWVYADSKDALKQAVATASAQGAVYGAISEYRDGYYLFHSASELKVITPSLLNQFGDVVNAIVVMMLDDNKVYLLIKQHHFIVGEYLFDHSAPTSNEFKLAATALFVVEQHAADFTVLTNTHVVGEGDHQSRLGGKLTLAVGAGQCQQTDQLSAEAIDIHTMVPFKQLPLLRQKSRHWPVLALAASLLLGVSYWFWPTNNTPIIQSGTAVVAPDPYQGLIDNLTKDAANPLFILSQVTKRMNYVSTLTGWQAFEVVVSQGDDQQFNLLVTLASHSGRNGRIDELVDFAQKQGYTLNMAGERAFLAANLGFMPVLSRAARFQIGSYERLTTARLAAWWDDTSTRFVRGKQDGTYVIETVHIKMPHIDVWDLHSLGSLFYGDPLSLVSVALKRVPGTTGLFEGEIEMTLAGVMINEMG